MHHFFVIKLKCVHINVVILNNMNTQIFKKGNVLDKLVLEKKCCF